MNGIRSAGEAQQIDLKDVSELSLTDVRVSSPACFGRGTPRTTRFHHYVPPHLQDNLAGDAEGEDPDQDDHSESGSSLDSQEDWAPPLYRPHFSSHGNRLPLKGQHLSDTEEAGQEDRGDKARETCPERPLNDYRSRQTTTKKVKKIISSQTRHESPLNLKIINHGLIYYVNIS